MDDVEQCDARKGGEVAVCGAHLTALPLNHGLTRLDASYVGTVRTTKDFRLFVLEGSRIRPRTSSLAFGACDTGLEL